jgi:hypothetical protein
MVPFPEKRLHDQSGHGILPEIPRCTLELIGSDRGTHCQLVEVFAGF